MLDTLKRTQDDRGCPCLYVTPCNPRCTCVNHFSSVGCYRCCRYGSLEQRRSIAKHLAEAIDSYNYLRAERLKAATDVAEFPVEICNSKLLQISLGQSEQEDSQGNQ